MLARDNPKTAAVIASELCAALYDLEIIKTGVEDEQSNATRFLLLSKTAFPGSGDKTSIVFAVPHQAGKLYDVLKLFAEAKINLTRIASIPRRSDPSNYNFFLDFEGTHENKKIADVLEQVQSLTIKMRNLGSYPVDTRTD
jgi:prephenate dehydratase